MPKLFLFVLLMPLTSMAQTEEFPVRESFTPITTRFSIEGGFRLPTPTGNKAYKTITRGISDAECLLKIKLHERFYVGAGMKHVYVEIRDFALNDKVNATTQIFNPKAELSYRAPMGDNTFFKLSLAGGYNFLQHRSNYALNAGLDYVRQRAINLEPSMGIYMYGSENFAVGLTMGFNMIFEEFTPDVLLQETLSGYSNLDFVGPYNYFSAGFTFIVYLQKNKDDF